MFNAGDVFLIPLVDDNGFGVGVVLDITPDALNSVLCGYCDIKFVNKDEFTLDNVNLKKLVSIQFTTPELLKNKRWPIVAKVQPVDPNDYFDYDGIKAKGFIGVDVRGASNIKEFVSAYQGVHHWNCFFKDDYLDDFLLFPDNKPDRIYYIEK